MDKIISMIITMLIGAAGGLLVHHLTKYFWPLKSGHHDSNIEDTNTISEEHIQKCLYHPNRGRSIKSVCRTIQDNNITPEFILVCPLTTEKKNG